MGCFRRFFGGSVNGLVLRMGEYKSVEEDDVRVVEEERG